MTSTHNFAHCTRTLQHSAQNSIPFRSSKTWKPKLYLSKRILVHLSKIIDNSLRWSQQSVWAGTGQQSELNASVSLLKPSGCFYSSLLWEALTIGSVCVFFKQTPIFKPDPSVTGVLYKPKHIYVISGVDVPYTYTRASGRGGDRLSETLPTVDPRNELVQANSTRLWHHNSLAKWGWRNKLKTHIIRQTNPSTRDLSRPGRAGE